jgi:hypothetical protein
MLPIVCEGLEAQPWLKGNYGSSLTSDGKTWLDHQPRRSQISLPPIFLSRFLLHLHSLVIIDRLNDDFHRLLSLDYYIQ